jgi:hypothetical protein
MPQAAGIFLTHCFQVAKKICVYLRSSAVAVFIRVDSRPLAVGFLFTH